MNSVITAITDFVTGIMTGFVGAATSLAGLFFEVGAEGAITIQPLGYFVLLSVGLVILRLVIAFVTRMLRSR